MNAGLSRTRDRLLSGISGIFLEGNADIETRLQKLEEVLLQAGDILYMSTLFV